MVLVAVGIHPLLNYYLLSSPFGLLSSQLGNGAFEIEYPGLYPCGKDLICFIGTKPDKPVSAIARQRLRSTK
jgi:hypothetical protein